MFIVLRKRTLGLFLSSILFAGISFGAYNFALHPNMQKWKEQKIVITEVKTDQKVVALTFDDGPDPVNTPAVLAALKKHKAQATFFVVGERAEKHPAILQQIVGDGHELGNHSLSHANFNHKDNDFLLNEIRQTNEIICRISGQKPVLFRPPGGYLSYDLVDLVQKEKLTIAYWTYQQDSKDWKGSSSHQITDHIIKNIKPGQIIILHDGCANGLETAKAVDNLIIRLSEQGYRFISMSKLIALGNKE